MSVKVKFVVKIDTASPKIAELNAALKDRTPLHSLLGDTGEIELKNHFASRPPNKRGWPQQFFWNRIASSTARLAPTAVGVSIAIADEAFNQKLYGGTIRPGAGKKYLAIPAIAEAYGKSPLSVDGLVPIFGHRGAGTGLLIKPGPKGSKIGTAWYFLVKSVTQRPDPEALPPEATFRAALLDTVEQYFARFS